MTSDLGDLNGAAGDGMPKKLSAYEGHDVSFTKAKFTSASNVEISDEELQLDEVYRFFVEARVVGVNHVTTNEGKLERVHVCKVQEVQLMDWDDQATWKQ